MLSEQEKTYFWNNVRRWNHVLVKHRPNTNYSWGYWSGIVTGCFSRGIKIRPDGIFSAFRSPIYYDLTENGSDTLEIWWL